MAGMAGAKVGTRPQEAALVRWRLGMREARGPKCNTIRGWVLIRKAILSRDDYCCRICRCEHNQLHAHHIDYDRSNNQSSNLVTLCRECHRLVHLEGYRPGEDDRPPPWGWIE